MSEQYLCLGSRVLPLGCTSPVLKNCIEHTGEKHAEKPSLKSLHPFTEYMYARPAVLWPHNSAVL